LAGDEPRAATARAGAFHAVVGWLGGLVGATYVTAVPLLIPEIGTAAAIGLTVAGQQLASLAVDRFGLLRLPKRRLTLARQAGVALPLAGVALIQVA
jgi:transporter family-2 protein